MYYANIYQFLQSPGDRQIVITLEEDHAYRVVPMDGRPHIGSNIKLWMGDSRGRWDGDTLVIDVTNQNNRHQFDRAWNFFSDSAHVVERYTMVDIDTIHYEATITDPEVFSRPWKLVHALARVKDLEPPEILEEACFEGERNWEVGLRGLYSMPDNTIPLPPGKPSVNRSR